MVQLFSFPKGLQFILSADQNPAFLNFDREKAIRLLEAQKRKGKYAHLDLPDTSRVTKGAQEEEEESISTQLHVRRPVGTMMEKSGVRRGGRLNKS